jgi:hypothetical protein
MPNTTNFNFPTPADTDLVKDGASAIRSLGNSIDSTFVDLKGGTTGQVLSKNSNTDLDFTWVAQDDSNAIQNAIVDAKGDLISASAADTPARLAVGTNGQFLQADSSTATGLKWAAVTVPTLPAFRAYSSGGTSLTGAAWTKLTFDTEVFDTDSKFASDRFTPGTAGYYQVSARARLNASGTANSLYLSIYKNGSTDAEDGTETNAYPSGNPSVLIYLDSDDYIEVYAYSVFSVSTNSGAAMQYFSAVGVRS